MKKQQKPSEANDEVLDEELKLITFFKISGSIAFIWGIFWILTSFIIKDWGDRGTFGDMFGAINSLFSGLALAGIIYTMLLQKQELRLQRLELKANREELARTATAQENSEKELRRQADNLKATARLNAMNTLISYHLDNVNINKSNPVAFMHDDWEKAQEYIKEIKSILNQKA